ncbi:hypothetical protein F4775DRAFT_129205 [Biscogniauxia sp. FL1348]|nr:hypothetical protein F4775DRAFT_129205 [Biscogniauxia sp. FL1348]
MTQQQPSEFRLDVSFYYEPRIEITFRTKDQAEQYKKLVEKQAPENMKLNAHVLDTCVSLRVPSCLTSIKASTSNRGLFLCFSDAAVAREWKEALLVVKSTSKDNTTLYVNRDIRDVDLNKLLNSREPEQRARKLERQTRKPEQQAHRSSSARRERLTALEHRERSTASKHRERSTASKHREHSTASKHRERSTASKHRERSTASKHREHSTEARHRKRSETRNKGRH